MILQIQQAITDNGSISADWVLVGISGIALLLFLRMLNRIEKNQETLAAIVSEHKTKIELHEQSIDNMLEEIRDLKTAQQ